MCAVRSDRKEGGGARAGVRIAALVVAGLAAGCSTDVSRFDFPVLGVTGPDSGAPAPQARPRNFGTTTGSTDRSAADEPLRQSAPARVGASGASDGEDQGASPVARNAGSVRVTGLPDVPGAAQPQGAQTTAVLDAPKDAPKQKRVAAVQPAPSAGAAPLKSATPAATAPVAAAAPAQVVAGSGPTVEVGQGDTLYKIARQHSVSVDALMKANNLQKPDIRPGQKLVIPAAAATAVSRVPTRAEAGRREAVATMQAAAGAPAQAAPAAAAAPGVLSSAGDTYTVGSGESFWGIARKLKVDGKELAQVNGITDVNKIRQGQVLKLPQGGGSAAGTGTAATTGAVQPSAAAPPRVVQTKTVPTGQAVPPAGTAPAAGPKVAALGAPSGQSAGQGSGAGSEASGSAGPAAKPGQAAAVQSAGVTQFRWPVKGKVIQAFGPKPDGSHNDGINISVPAGTDVLAAESGTVAYAGNELKGYGNLVLIRHDENWVSAYAHNDTLLVKRGDKVKRGQPVAKAGKSGTVDSPQVHFELRQGSKPVDPLKHLAASN
jgi:murein DD-endopeptidase MepM/ murein hydrolase activator NlpD